MTPPRYIVPGQLCFVTARAVEGMFKLLPERKVNDLVAYIFHHATPATARNKGNKVMGMGAVLNQR